MVLLPEPERPVMATNSPSLISNDRFFKTTVGGLPKDFTMFLATSPISASLGPQDVDGVHAASLPSREKTSQHAGEKGHAKGGHVKVAVPCDEHVVDFGDANPR